MACGSRSRSGRAGRAGVRGGVPLPVAGDGTVLAGLRPPAGLALLRMEKPVSDGHVTDPRTLRALLVAGAAPAASRSESSG